MQLNILQAEIIAHLKSDGMDGIWPVLRLLLPLYITTLDGGMMSSGTINAAICPTLLAEII